MSKTGIATIPLHYGKTPRWLFERMKLLAREIILAMVCEFQVEDILKKFSDPYWFQAFGCVLGFDWHSSGITTTVLGAVKDGIRGLEQEIGLYIAGGKGATSRKTPDEIKKYGGSLSCDVENLVYASRMSAKVDNAAVQDGYNLYHHVFLFTEKGHWAVIQQGMNPEERMARRYHWLGDSVNDFVVEPHSAICCEKRSKALNMVSRKSEETRNISVEIARQNPEKTMREIISLKEMNLPRRHTIMIQDINPQRIYSTLLRTYEHQPEDFEQLLGINGIGPKTIRALSLVSELIYGRPPDYTDPARFSFAHGGKDRTPFPVDRRTYDRSIEIMKKAVEAARIGQREKLEAIKRLARFYHV
jgi:hypothetical protein